MDGGKALRTVPGTWGVLDKHLWVLIELVTPCCFLLSCGLSEDRTLQLSADGIGWTDQPVWGYLSSPSCCFHTEGSKGAHAVQEGPMGLQH